MRLQKIGSAILGALCISGLGMSSLMSVSAASGYTKLSGEFERTLDSSKLRGNPNITFDKNHLVNNKKFKPIYNIGKDSNIEFEFYDDSGLFQDSKDDNGISDGTWSYPPKAMPDSRKTRANKSTGVFTFKHNGIYKLDNTGLKVKNALKVDDKFYDMDVKITMIAGKTVNSVGKNTSDLRVSYDKTWGFNIGKSNYRVGADYMSGSPYTPAQRLQFSREDTKGMEFDVDVTIYEAGTNKIAKLPFLKIGVSNLGRGTNDQYWDNIALHATSINNEKLTQNDLLGYTEKPEMILSKIGNNLVISGTAQYIDSKSPWIGYDGRKIPGDIMVNYNKFIADNSGIENGKVGLSFYHYVYSVDTQLPILAEYNNVEYKASSNGKITGTTKEAIFTGLNPHGTTTQADPKYKFNKFTADKDVKLKDGSIIKKGDKITKSQLKQAVITEDITFTAHFVYDGGQIKINKSFK